MKNKKGFTLVELLAVIVILGVIMIIAIPSVLNTLESSRKSTFSLYAKKVVVAAEKTNYQEELQQKITGKGIYTYNIKEDLDFNSTGNYEGYVVIDNCTENEKQFYLYLNDGTNMVYDYHDNDENEVLESSNYGPYEEETWTEKAGSREAAAASVMNMTGGYACALYGANQSSPLGGGEGGSIPNTPTSSNSAVFIDGPHFDYTMINLLAGQTNFSLNNYEGHYFTHNESLKEGSTIDQGGTNAITSISRSNTISEEQKNRAKKVSTDDSPNEIWMWIEGTKIYWYTEAKKAFVNKNGNYMFAWVNGVTNLNLSEYDFSQTESLDMAFAGDTKITSLDFSSMNVANLRTITEAFGGMTGLKTVDLSMWNTRSLTDPSYLFCYCLNLISIKLPANFVTSKTTSIAGLFDECQSLVSVDLSRFNTSNAKSMRYMFYNCKKLKNINLSSFNTSNVTEMRYMFYGASSITSLDLSNFDTSKVTDFEGIFAYMTSLTSINVANWNVSSANSLIAMFFNCTGLTSLDLSGWSIKNGADTSYLFKLTKLKTIIVSESWKDKIGESIQMFYNTKALKGGNGTSWSSSYINGARAVIDGENGQKGYFTSNKPKAVSK